MAPRVAPTRTALLLGHQRRRWVCGLLVTLLLVGMAGSPARSQVFLERTDVLVLGGSPAGVAAALAAARQGRDVILVEPRPYLGTVVTGAMLNMWDLNWGPHHESTVRGIFGEFFQALHGLTFDPMLARTLFKDKISAESRIRLYTETRILRPVMGDTGVIGAVLQNATGTHGVRAAVTIDTTDDADIAAAAGVEYTIGRETSGIDRTMQPATLLFRVRDVDWTALVRYIVEEEKPLRRGGVNQGVVWGLGTIVRQYRSDDPGVRAYDLNIGRLPDGSVWINSLQIFDVDGTNEASRRDAYARAKLVVPAFVEFLRAKVPGFERATLVQVAPQLYIRETRHIRGLYVLTALDIQNARRFWDRIAVASYPMDLHPYRPDEFNPFRPVRRLYTIPLRSLIPEKLDGLLVASRALSATYQAAGSARIVPTTIALGEAAGVAASVCIEQKVSPHGLIQQFSLVALVQQRLQRAGARINP